MHDQPRVRDEELDVIKKAIRDEMVLKYRALLDKCHEMNRTFTPETATEDDLEPLSRILQISTDAYTFYNLRKKIVLTLIRRSGADTEQARRLLRNEFEFVSEQLKRDFKSYCTWHHRRWIYTQLESDTITYTALLEKDLAVCEKLLAQDARNFHCWSYRRWVRGALAIVKKKNAMENEKSTGSPQNGEDHSDETENRRELAYTAGLIGYLFSNYSAWNSRIEIFSQNITWLDLEEVDYVLQALFCDPRDSSAFMYTTWLLSVIGTALRTEAAQRIQTACEELIALEGELKWPLWMQLQIALAGYLTPVPSVDTKSVLTGGDVDDHRMSSVESNVSEIWSALLVKLIRVDPRHQGYYEDMRIKLLPNRM